METLRSVHIEYLFPAYMRNCPPIGLGLTLSVPIPADALPISDKAFLMIGADECMDVGYGCGMRSGWHWIGRLVWD